MQTLAQYITYINKSFPRHFRSIFSPIPVSKWPILAFSLIRIEIVVKTYLDH